MQESDEDRLIAKWHELAEEIDGRASVDLLYATGLLNDVLRTFAPTLHGPQTQESILPFVVSTRQLERSWNQQLGKTLIDAGNAFNRGDRAAALTILDRFAEQCPWIPFAQIAKDQRSNYAAR